MKSAKVNDVQQAVNWFEDDTVDGPKYRFHVSRIFHSRNEKDALYRISATPHFAADVRRFLDKTFPGRWIGRGDGLSGRRTFFYGDM